MERVVGDGIDQVVRGSLRVTNIDELAPADFLVYRHAQRFQRAMRSRAMAMFVVVPASAVPIIAANALWGGAIGAMAGAGTAFASMMAISQLQQRRRTEVQLPDGELLSLTRGEGNHVSLETEGESWRVRVPVMGVECVLRGS